MLAELKKLTQFEMGSKDEWCAAIAHCLKVSAAAGHDRFVLQFGEASQRIDDSSNKPTLTLQPDEYIY